jgi:hypothetical protein
MKNLKSWRLLISLTLAVTCFSVSALAQSSKKREPIASVSLQSTVVQWAPHVDHERLALTVSTPDGEVFREEFESGRAPTFELVGKRGAILPDGYYKYELRLIPKLAGGITETLAAARAEGTDVETGRELQRIGLLPTNPIVQSGSFLVRNGSFVTGDATEPRLITGPGAGKGQVETQSKKGGGEEEGPVVPFDQVIADDLIVQGSICAGLDCVNNENFGFDTIKMKENNTRIKFEDTSTTTGFPSTDWQLTANDSASGGLNKFSIEDITAARVPFTIEGSTPTNSLYLDSTGRVGLRTSTPVLDLHVATSNTPAFRLEQNNSGGFTAQTWDIAGNEANFFVRDVTSGSRLPLRIRPGAPTSSLDIAADGSVGIGTGSPSFRLDALTNAAGVATARLTNSNATGFTGIEYHSDSGSLDLFFGVDNANNTTRLNSINNNPIVLLTNSTERFRIQSGGNVGINCNAPGSNLVIASGAGCANPSSSINAGATQFTAASSRTFKENASRLDVPNILDKIGAIPVYHYDFIKGPKDRIGLMAEDFHQVFGRGSEKYLDGNEVQMALWLAVRELTARTEELRRDNEKLRQEIEELKGRQ